MSYVRPARYTIAADWLPSAHPGGGNPTRIFNETSQRHVTGRPVTAAGKPARGPPGSRPTRSGADIRRSCCLQTLAVMPAHGGRSGAAATVWGQSHAGRRVSTGYRPVGDPASRLPVAGPDLVSGCRRRAGTEPLAADVVPHHGGGRPALRADRLRARAQLDH